MIVSHDADWVECGGDLRGHFDIGAGRCRIAAWMMMHHDQSGGREFQGALDDLAKIKGFVIDGTSLLNLALGAEGSFCPRTAA